MGCTSSSNKAPRGPVTYDSTNHVQILFQCVGSTWPRVFPFCVTNVLFMILLEYARDYFHWTSLGITNQGHTFAGVIVSFLVVSRINTALSRYFECRNHIGLMFRETRELIQNMYVFTRRKITTIESKEWRSEVAYRMLLLLRVSVSVIEYPSEKVPAWLVPELTGVELEYCRPTKAWFRHEIRSTTTTNTTSTTNSKSNKTDFSNSMRVPLRMVYLLRESITSQEERLMHPLHTLQELKLLASVDSFMNGYFGMTKFMTTPVPFPLVQMSRTLVLLYVYTIPFVLLNNTDTLIERCLVVFVLTFGFMGLELVSIEMDDPFGNDDNDFDCLKFSKSAFEDTYLLIHDGDGEEWADAIRYKMYQSPSDPVSETEISALLPGSVV